MVSKQYFQRNPDEFLRWFITVDETWIHYFTPETKEVKIMDFTRWTSSEEGEDRKISRKGHSFLRSTRYNSYSIIFRWSKRSIAITTQPYDRFNNILKKKHLHLAKKKVSSIKTMHEFICARHGWSNSTNSATNCFPIQHIRQNLASCDYFLFPNLKKWFEGKRFTTREHLIAEIEVYFEGLDKSYSDGLKKLENHGSNVSKGDYEK